MAVENLHIKKIRVENYKSLRNTEVELKDGLNIIIGKNGAGKSNMLDFIYRYTTRPPIILHRTVRPAYNFFVELDYKSNKKSYHLSYLLERFKSDNPSSTRYNYQITVNKKEGKTLLLENKKIYLNDFNNKVENDDKEITRELRNLSISRRYMTFIFPTESTWVSKPCRIVITRDSEDETEFEIDEESEFNFFYNIELEIEFSLFSDISKETFKIDIIKEKLTKFLFENLEASSINDILPKFTPIEKIRFNPNINIYVTENKVIIENLYIDFFINNEWMPWSYLSDGTKRIFYIISECIDNGSRLLLIEEPELGIHPHQLYKLLDFLKEQAKEKQIIISTHSPLALDVLDEKELNRIIIAEYNNGTKFRHLTKAETSKAKKYMTEVGDLSTYWLHSDLEQ